MLVTAPCDPRWSTRGDKESRMQVEKEQEEQEEQEEQREEEQEEQGEQQAE